VQAVNNSVALNDSSSQQDFLKLLVLLCTGEHITVNINPTDHEHVPIPQDRCGMPGPCDCHNPEDTVQSIESNLAFARRYVDWPYIQHPTPYPRTPMTEDFRQRGLITNEHLEEYDGTTAVVRTEHVPAEEIEYMRWKAERWMKVRHMPAAFRHDPWFVVRHAPEMLAHTFRGSTLRSVLRLKSGWKAFERYKAIRRQERSHL
jgi:anaerobic magnesium-protoporphyrin IX monomethyl ester cyclase